MAKRVLPKPRRLPAAKQRRLDALLEKNCEGTIKPHEKAVLQRLVAKAEQLMVANAQRLAQFLARQADAAPHDAMPVTVWVKAEHAGR